MILIPFLIVFALDLALILFFLFCENSFDVSGPYSEDAVYGMITGLSIALLFFGLFIPLIK